MEFIQYLQANQGIQLSFVIIFKIKFLNSNQIHK